MQVETTCRNSRKSSRFSPPGEMRPISSESPEANHTEPLELPKGPSHPCCNSRSSRHTRLHSRRSTRDPPTSSGAPFPPPSSSGGILSLSVRERIPGVPVASQEEALSTGKARGTPGSCHQSQSPPDVSVHSRETCFPCTASTFKPRIHSHHGGTWDSPVGKPRGKASWESLKGKPQIP